MWAASSVLTRVDTWGKFLEASTDLDLWMDGRGVTQLLPDNMFPNQYGLEISDDGAPVSWDLDWGEDEVVGNHVNMSRPGVAPNLRSRSATRQTSAFVPLSEAGWSAQEAWVAGIVGDPDPGTGKPPAPDLEAVPNGNKGFEAGTWGWAWGVSDAFGPCTVTGVRFFAMKNGERPVVTIPEGFSPGSRTFDVYMTEKDGGENTLALVRQIPIEMLRGSTVPINGPWRNRGRPPRVNRTGIQHVPRMSKGRDYELVPSHWHTMAGTWQPAHQIKNPRGTSLLGPWGRGIWVEPTKVRVRKPGPAPTGAPSPGEAPSSARSAQAGAQAGSRPHRRGGGGGGGGAPSAPLGGGGGRRDPREVRPSGKHPERRYHGEEIDWWESELVATINRRRRELGVPPLVLNRKLNRACYRSALGREPVTPSTLAEQEGYGSDTRTLTTRERSPKGAWRSLAGKRGVDPCDERFDAIGVAREKNARGTWQWVVLLGDDPEMDPSDVAYCEAMTVQHVEEDGRIYSVELPTPGHSHAPEGVSGDVGIPKPMMQDLGWDNVAVFEDNSARLGWSYNGSYDDAVQFASDAWNALGKVSVRRGGGELAITDGALPDGIAGRTYSDGRQINSSSLFRRGTKNMRRSVCGHEKGHSLRFAHIEGAPSIMKPGVVVQSTSNAEGPTSLDKREYNSQWGFLQNNSGGGSGGSGGSGGGSGDPDIEQDDGPQREIRDPTGLLDEFFGGGRKGGGRDPGGGETPEEPEEPEFHWVDVTLPYRVKTALFFKPPRMMSAKTPALDELRYTTWWLHTDLSGNQKVYRSFYALSNRGTASYFADDGAWKDGVAVPGLAPDAAAGLDKKNQGPPVRLAEEEIPQENTTIVEPPDPSSPPDEPTLAGQELLPADKYYMTVSAVTKGGKLSRASEPGRDANGNPFVQTTALTMPRAVFATSLNELRNAEWSSKDAKGNPEDWTLTNLGATTPGFFKVTDGVLRLWTVTNTNLQPSLESKLMPVGGERVTTIAGTAGATRVTAGSIGLVLVQYGADRKALKDAQGNLLSPIVVVDVASVGERTFEARFTAEDFAPECALVAASARIRGVLSGQQFQHNADGYFHSLRVYPFAADIGKVAPGAPGEPADFDPPPVTPCPAGPFAYVGEPPIPSGGSQDLDDPALDTLGFEDGTTGLWTPVGTAPAAMRGVQPSAGIHEINGYRAQDNSTGGAHTAYLERQFPELVGQASALRTIYRFDLKPTDGVVRLHRIAGSGGAIPAVLAVGPLGNVSVVVSPNGSPPVSIPLDVTVYNGTILDVEIAFVPGKQGLLTIAVGLGGGKRQIVLQRTFDFEGRSADVMDPGVTYTLNSYSRHNIAFDQVVVTRRGDVPDRERLTAPAGWTPPPEDRPKTAAGDAPRSFEPDGERMRQLRVFVPAGYGEKVLPLLERPLPVRPGCTFAAALFGRWSCFTDEASAGLRVTLIGESDDVAPLVVAEAGRPRGERGWHPTSAGEANRDDHDLYTVPLEGGYTHAVLEIVVRPGYYVFQEFLHALQRPANLLTGAPAEDLSVFAQRDAKRGYGRALEAAGEFILDSMPVAAEAAPDVGNFYSELGAKVLEDETPVGSLEVEFSTSHDGVGWLPYTDRDSVSLRLLKQSLFFSGDGRDGPMIAPGGIYLRSWSPVGVLLRADGTAFPGGAYVGNLLSATSYADVEVKKVGGRLVLVPQSEEIGRLDQGIKITVFTEAAKKEIERNCLLGEFLLELPYSGGTYAGESMLIRFGGQVSLEVQPVPQGVAEYFGVSGEPFRVREIYAVGETEYAEVLELAPLQGPMGEAVLGSADDAPEIATLEAELVP